MTRINWEELKKEYILGEFKSLNDFAKDKGLKRDGNFNKQTKGWATEKATREQQKGNKIIEKTTELEIVKEVDRNQKVLTLVDKVISATEKALSEELNIHVDMFGKVHKSPVIKADKLESLMRTLTQAQKAHRLAEGLSTENNKNSNTNTNLNKSVDDMTLEEIEAELKELESNF